MHGRELFPNPRLTAEQFPSAPCSFQSSTHTDDQSLEVGHYSFTLAISAPKPRGFDKKQLTRQGAVFRKANVHCPCLTFTLARLEPAHPEEIGIDDFPVPPALPPNVSDHAARGLWSHQKGGFVTTEGSRLDELSHYDSI